MKAQENSFTRSEEKIVKFKKLLNIHEDRVKK
jgi:hypothetical protein